MSIAITANPSQQIRSLAQKGLDRNDIRELTGFELRLIDLALSRKPRDKVKARRRIEAKGPLSAAQVAERTGMPLSAAKLMVR
jgi:hypothetical protein